MDIDTELLEFYSIWNPINYGLDSNPDQKEETR